MKCLLLLAIHKSIIFVTDFKMKMPARTNLWSSACSTGTFLLLDSSWSLWMHITAEKDTSEGRPVCVSTAKSIWWSTYVFLLQIREFIPVGETVQFYLPDKRDQEFMNCQRRLSVLLQILHVLTLKCKLRCQIQIVNFPNIYWLASYWVGCMAPWWYKSITFLLCFARKQLSPWKWKSISHISNPRLRKKAECSARPGRSPRFGVWLKKYVEQGINLNAPNMHWQMGEDFTN